MLRSKIVLSSRSQGDAITSNFILRALASTQLASWLLLQHTGCTTIFSIHTQAVNTSVRPEYVDKASFLPQELFFFRITSIDDWMQHVKTCTENHRKFIQYWFYCTGIYTPINNFQNIDIVVFMNSEGFGALIQILVWHQ